jgi:hypothetical protein
MQLIFSCLKTFVNIILNEMTLYISAAHEKYSKIVLLHFMRPMTKKTHVLHPNLAWEHLAEESRYS